jgi:hypothetical protein
MFESIRQLFGRHETQETIAATQATRRILTTVAVGGTIRRDDRHTVEQVVGVPPHAWEDLVRESKRVRPRYEG